MGTPGFVYILENKSLPGLLKIGCTTKDPHERAKEISGGTGVTIPFQVTYLWSSRNCFEHESFVHEKLKKVSN